MHGRQMRSSSTLIMIKCLFILSSLSYVLGAKVVNQLRSRPLDYSNVQLSEQNKFLGDALWYTMDVITFGALESKNNKKKPKPPDNQTN